MKTLTINNLSIQIDVEDDCDSNTVLNKVKDAIEQINGVLQREPYGLGAQILPTDITPDNVSLDEFDTDEM